MQDEKVKVLRRHKDTAPGDVVRGQFNGYRNEPGVKPNSTSGDLRGFAPAHRFVALEGSAVLHSGGKIAAGDRHRSARRTAASSRRSFRAIRRPHNYLRFRVTPDLDIAAGGQVKESGDEMAAQPVELLASQESDPAELSAYQELLDDAMHGDPTASPAKTMSRRPGALYSRFSTMRLRCTVRPGTWGPAEAEKLTSETGGWRNPR